MADDLKKGLEGVLVAESGLSSIDGDAGRLIYRGYPIEDLARGASYEEVLYLLWHGELPTADELEEFSAALTEEREVSDDVLATMERLAAADEQPMAALRTAVSMFSASEPETEAEPEDLEATLRKGRRITAKIPTALAAFERYRLDEEPVDPHPDLGLAANFLYMLTGEEPSDVHAETFDQALILHADHGLNASTFTSMVIGSTMADIYSAVTGGVCALSGPLHGGANQDVMEVLFEIDESNKDPLEWVEEATEEGRRIPGFGHRVYKTDDPRSLFLREVAERLGGPRVELAQTVEKQAVSVLQELKPGRQLYANVEFYSAIVMERVGLPREMFTPTFTSSRSVGWTAHIMEQAADNRLIRPAARYVGPPPPQEVPAPA